MASSLTGLTPTHPRLLLIFHCSSLWSCPANSVYLKAKINPEVQEIVAQQDGRRVL